MLKVQTSAVNGTLDRDHAVAERWADGRFGDRSDPSRFWTVPRWGNGRSPDFGD
jgi:hypothetical protein